MSLNGASIDEIKLMTVSQLRERLKGHQLPVKGNKDELIQRLSKALNPETPANEVRPEAVHPNNPVSKTNEASKVDPVPSATITTAPATTTATAPSNGTEAHTEEVADISQEDVDANNGKPIQDNPIGKKKQTTRRIEMEGLPEDLREWELDARSDEKKKKPGAKAEAISQNLGVTTAELILKRQERIKRYGLQSMPEQTKRMLRKQRFLKSKTDEHKDKDRSSHSSEPKEEDLNADANENATSSNDANGNKTDNPNEIDDTKDIKIKTKRDGTDFNDFSVESLFGENEVSKGLTSEILSARRKRFGDKAIADAFQQSTQKTFQNTDRDRNRDRNRNGNLDRIQNRNRNRNGNNTYADNRNRSYHISSNTQRHNRRYSSPLKQHDKHRRNADDIAWNEEDRNKIRARMLRFGKLVSKGDDERDVDKRLDSRYKNRRDTSDNDRSRSRERRQEKTKAIKLEKEIKENTYQPSSKTGEAMKDFGSDDEYINSREELKKKMSD